jgi:hypothetical protein
MPRYPVVRTASAWSLTNLGAGYAKRVGPPMRRYGTRTWSATLGRSWEGFWTGSAQDGGT